MLFYAKKYLWLDLLVMLLLGGSGIGGFDRSLFLFPLR